MLTEFENSMIVARSLRQWAKRLDGIPEYDPKIVRLMNSMIVIAHMIEIAPDTPPIHQLTALGQIMVEEMDRVVAAATA